jgi:lysophospholipase L1-like esterase
VTTGLRTPLAAGKPAHPRTGEASLVAKPRDAEPAWVARFQKISAEAHRGDAKVVFLGDSITQGWEYSPLWKQHFGPLHALNAGIASDRVEHILWRVQHGNFAKVKPKVVVLLGGINNLAVASPLQIADGIRRIIGEIHRRSPATRVLLLGLFPSGASPQHPRRAKIRKVNAELAQLATLPQVTYADIGAKFLQRDGSLSKPVMFDYLHLSHRGYQIWLDALAQPLQRLLDQSNG